MKTQRCSKCGSNTNTPEKQKVAEAINELVEKLEDMIDRTYSTPPDEFIATVTIARNLITCSSTSVVILEELDKMAECEGFGCWADKLHIKLARGDEGYKPWEDMTEDELASEAKFQNDLENATGRRF